MIPFPYKILGAAALVFSVALGSYLKGRSDVNEKWDAERAIQQAAYDAAVADKLHIENEREKLVKEINDDLKPKLAAVTADAKSLANRLRLAARSSSLPSTPGTPGSTDPTSGRGSGTCEFAPGVGEALENLFGASARDAERLNAWISFYRQLQESQP